MSYVLKYIKRVKYVVSGAAIFYKTETNAWLLTAYGLGLFLAIVIQHITRIESLLIFILFTLLCFAEIINTSLEKALDAVHPDKHPLIKQSKDLAAFGTFLVGFVLWVYIVIIFIQ